MVLRELIPDSRSLREAARRLPTLDGRRLRQGVDRGQVAVRARFDQIERDTRPLREEARGRIERWDRETRPVRRRAARRAIDRSYKALDRIDARAGTGRHRRGAGGVFLAAILGVVAGVGVGYALADRRSRKALQGGLAMVKDQALDRVPALVDRAGGTLEELRSRWSKSGSGAEEALLRSGVESAVHSDPSATGLEVGVEGRTVYLRGSARGRETLDAAIERARSVAGVAAVINLASVAAGEKDGRAGEKAGKADRAENSGPA